MLFKNEKPKHINYGMLEFSRKMPIVDEVNQGNNQEISVCKSINLTRKIKLKPINQNCILNNDEKELVLPKIGTRSSLKEINLLTQNIVEETEREVHKKLLKTSKKDPNKNIKININIENININKNTVFIKEEEKILREHKININRVDNSKLIKTVRDYKKVKIKKFILEIIKNLRSNKNYNIIMKYLKEQNIETNTLKFLNNILNFKTSINKNGFNSMLKLIKLYIFSLKYSKRVFVKNLKDINENFKQMLNKTAIIIQKIFKGYLFRKKNKHINEINLKRKIAIIIIQKKTRGILSRKRNIELMNSFKEFKRIQQMKRDYLIQRKLVLKQAEAVRVIENFWSSILEKRDDEKLDQQIANMPEECKNLYRKFVNLRKQTNNLKKDLVKIGMKK